MTQGIGTPALWVSFSIFILVLLGLDFFVFHKKSHTVKPKEALAWTGVWVSLAMAFAGFVWARFGSDLALQFVTGFVIEKALSVDNLFVFMVVFSYFAVPPKVQHDVLFWGILGALVMRLLFVVAGAALITHFHWVAYVFGAFLIFTGVKLLIQRDEGVHPERNPVLKLVRRLVPVTKDYRDDRFFVREAGQRLATPLFLVLVVIEATDIVFAVDSIPAIFAVSTDPFIVYTSNIFAILGLRSLYFALSGMMGRFHYIKPGLAMVLAFVGAKMLLSGVIEVPVVVSLLVVATLLGGSVAASLFFPPQRAPE